MATALPPPPRKEDQRFDNWVFTLWKRAVAALVSGGVGATSPITITTSGTGTVNIGHGTSGVVTGTYGSQSSIPILAVDTYGHITLATSSAVAISGTNVTGANLTVSSPLIGTATNALLRAGTVGHGTSGVTGGTYGGASQVGRVVVDTWGHITGATSVDIAINGTAVTGANLTPGAELVGTATNALLRAGTIAHATSGAIPATYGNQSTVPIITVNTYGHITLATSSAINIAGTAVTGADLTISAPLVGTATNALLRAGTVGHAVSGVVSGTYGGALGVPRVVVDTWGHVTAGTSFPLQATAPILVGSNAGTFTWGHSTSGVVTGTFGAASVIPQVVVNTWGHVTAINTLNVAVSGTAVTGADLTVNSPLQGTVTNALLRAGAIGHGTSGVLPGTLGAYDRVARIVVDTYGHVTSGTSLEPDYARPDFYLSLPGTGGNYASTPDSAALDLTGDFDARVKVAADDWTPSSTVFFFAKDMVAKRTFSFGLKFAGLYLEAYDSAGNSFLFDSTVAPSVVDGGTLWVRVACDWALAGNITVTFYTSPDGETWTQLGTQRTAAATGNALGNFDNPLHLGQREYTGNNQWCPGKYYYAEIRNGIDGPVVAKFDANDAEVIGDTSFVSSQTGETWTINQSGSPAAEIVKTKESGAVAVWNGTSGKRLSELPPATVSVTSPITISGTNTDAVLRPFTIAHATSGIVPGTFGGAASIPQVVVNTYGHVTAVNTFALSGTNVAGQDLTINSPLQGTVTNALLRAGAISHGVSGVVTGTYGGSGVSLQVVVNTFGHVTAASTFASGSTDYPLVKGFVPDGSSVTIDDGYQLLCVGMTVFGTGTIIVEGTGILAVL